MWGAYYFLLSPILSNSKSFKYHLQLVPFFPTIKFFFRSQKGIVEHRKTRACLWCFFLSTNQKELQVKHFFHGQALVTSLSWNKPPSKSTFPLGPPSQSHDLGQNLAFGHVEKYVWITKALVPMALSPASIELLMNYKLFFIRWIHHQETQILWWNFN